MQACILHRIKRNEHVGHDSAAAIHRAMLAQSDVFERVGKVNGVFIGEFAVLKTVL